MTFHYLKDFRFLVLTLLWVPYAKAAVVSMKIITPAQRVTVNECSQVVKVQAIDKLDRAGVVSQNVKVYFTGSSKGLTFYKDSSCNIKIANSIMKAGTGTSTFYFSAVNTGNQKVIVATNNYNDDEQTEVVVEAPLPSPTPAPTPTPTGPTPGRSGRVIPSPIYGVTVDSIVNVSAIVTSLNAIAKFPTTRVVFDASNSARYYADAINLMHGSSYIMGQILDSTDMAKTSVAAYKSRTQSYVDLLGSTVDVWEIGNEINGAWLGKDTMLTGDKVRTAYDVVHAANGATALTFYWEGNPGEAGNCVDGPGYDMFGWINNFIKNPENERVRLGLDYVFISWYPQQCNNIQPNWVDIFTKLSSIFPNSKVGFGEIGTAKPQGGSSYEVNLMNQFYSMGSNSKLPAAYVGGYFWWYFYEEMIPANKTILMDTMNSVILRVPNK